MDIILNFLNLPLFCHLFTDLVFSGRIVPVFREDGNTEKWWSQERRNILNPPPPKSHHLIIIAVTNLSWVVIRLDNLSLTFQPFQRHLIKHPCLFNHSTQYHIIQIIRRYVLGIQAHTFIFSRLRFRQLKMMPFMEVAVCRSWHPGSFRVEPLEHIKMNRQKAGVE